jgi:Fic family protein
MADFSAPSRRERRSCQYEAYVPDPLVPREFALEGEVAADVADAEAAISRLNVEASSLVDTEALARILLRAESVASSKIEGLQVGARRLLRAEAASRLDDGAIDVTAKEVLGNIEAMVFAVQSVGVGDTITLEMLFELHRRLLAGSFLERHGGRFRDVQNWIGGSDYHPCDAAFVPAPPELVGELVDDLIEFCNEDSLPAVAQASIAHAQFETIHPFTDGNGRIGRIVILLVLRRRGATPQLVPPISLVLLAHQQAYVDALQDYRLVRRTPWLSLFIDACSIAATGAHDLSERIAILQDEWREAANQPRSDSAAERLISLLPATPVLNLKAARALTRRSDQATLTALAALQAAAVLRETTAGRRNRVWESVGLFALLDQFERDYSDPLRTPADTRSN